MEGWIKLHRESLDHWLYNEYRPLTKREAWENIIIWANFKSSKVLIKGQLMDCDRGQLLYSLETYAEKFVWSIGQVRSFFKLLQNDKMIILEGLKYTTRLTVCNYDKYQEQQQTDNKLTTDSQQADDILTTNSEQQDKNDKKVKNDKNEKEEALFENSEILISEEKNELLSETEQLPLETEKEKKKKSCAKKEKPEITQEIADLLSICTAKFNEKYVNDKTIAMFAKLLKSYSNEQIKQAIENGTKDDFWRMNFLSPSKLADKDKNGVYYIDKFINLKPNGANWSNNKAKQPEHLHNGGKFTTAVTKENF